MPLESRTWNTLVNKLNYNKIYLIPSAICSHGCDELQDPEFCLATHAVERSNTIFILGVFLIHLYIKKNTQVWHNCSARITLNFKFRHLALAQEMSETWRKTFNFNPNVSLPESKMILTTLPWLITQLTIEVQVFSHILFVPEYVFKYLDTD